MKALRRIVNKIKNGQNEERRYRGKGLNSKSQLMSPKKKNGVGNARIKYGE